MTAKAKTAHAQQVACKRRSNNAKGSKAAVGEQVSFSLVDQTTAPQPPSDCVASWTEFLACVKHFHLPHKQAHVKWNYEERMAAAAALEFRGTTTFLIGGVPHHALGAWHRSKKASQQDLADSALSFFVGCWGQQLSTESTAPDGETMSVMSVDGTSQGLDWAGESPEVVLEQLCLNLDTPCSPMWHLVWGDNLCQALVQIEILGVMHTMKGPDCACEADARAETAKRTLWYLKAPGYEFAFEPSSEATAAAMDAQPPKDWCMDDGSEEAMRRAEEKTIVMHVQNRLQQILAQRPGHSIWEWSYEERANSRGSTLIRATLKVSALDVAVTSKWFPSQRHAQQDASSRMASFLDNKDSAPDYTCS
jgi:hypothetical protein